MYLWTLGIICSLYVIQIHAGRCKDGQKFLTLKKNSPNFFDMHDRAENGVNKLRKVAKGLKGTIKLMAMDTLSIDGNGQEFSLNKLCMRIKGATQITFKYMAGMNLNQQVGANEIKVIKKPQKFSKVCSDALPTDPIGGIIMIINDDIKVFENPNAKSVEAKSLDLRACPVEE